MVVVMVVQLTHECFNSSTFQNTWKNVEDSTKNQVISSHAYSELVQSQLLQKSRPNTENLDLNVGEYILDTQ